MFSRTIPFTHPRRTAALLAAALLPGIAAAAAAPDYSGSTAGRFIPFENAGTHQPPLNEAPKLRFAIQRKSFTAPMDTGTTGVMLSASAIPDYTANTQCKDPASYPGWEFLSSSKRLWVGHWIAEEIDFLDGRGAAAATARVPVLAVECEVRCPDYDEKAAQPTCPGKSLAPASRTIHYLGVGFGREHDGQPQGTPDKNPLLNIVRIDGAPVSPGAMHRGYILTPKGVHVGLTAKNTSGFAFMSLTGPKYSDSPLDWPQASICVAVDGSACLSGSVLVDTGIPQMYLTVPPGVAQVDRAPDLSDRQRMVPALKNGSRVTVRFPGDPGAAAFYSFVVGDTANPMRPAQVIVSQRSGPTFVNTGRHFLRNFDVLFDAEGGLFGLRWTGPAGSAGGGLTPQSP